MMTPSVRSIRHTALPLVAALLAGCASGRAEGAPSPTSTAAAWASVMGQAEQEVQAGRYAAAERMLLAFQQSHPAAPEAAEAAYYRALFDLDPANAASSPHDAIVVLDAMLATPIVSSVSAAVPSPRHADAVALRRVASALETRIAPVVVAAPAAAAPPARADESRAKDDEITKLRDDLAKANAELERIKRRVASPKP